MRQKIVENMDKTLHNIILYILKNNLNAVHNVKISY